MTRYRVEWSIDIEADTPEQAARQARAIQRALDSTATVFDVYDNGKRTVIDLLSHHDDNDRAREYSNAPDLDTRGNLLREGK